MSNSERGANVPDPSYHQAVGLAAAIGGAMAVKVLGMGFLLPFAAGLITLLIVRATAPRSKAFHHAIAVQSGHLVWMLVEMFLLVAWGMATLSDGAAAIGFDVVCLAVGLLSLLRWPGVGPVMLLSLYQALALISNALQYRMITDADLQRALTTHMLLRGLALGFMAYGLVVNRRSENDPVPVEHSVDFPVSASAEREADSTV